MEKEAGIYTDWLEEQALRQRILECRADEQVRDEIWSRHWNLLSWLVVGFMVLYVVLQLGRLWGRTEAEELQRQQDVIWEDKRL